MDKLAALEMALGPEVQFAGFEELGVVVAPLAARLEERVSVSEAH